MKDIATLLGRPHLNWINVGGNGLALLSFHDGYFIIGALLCLATAIVAEGFKRYAEEHK